MRALIKGIAAIALLAPLAPAQEVVRQWFGDTPNQQFGGSIAWVGDVNADGFVDFGVTVPLDDTKFASGGMVRVISGKDGAVIHNFYGDAVGANLGIAGLGHPLGDLDLDGYDDVLVNERYGIGFAPPGRIFVFSGRDGSVLLTVTGDSKLKVSGSICGTGDVDGDGVPDFAVAPQTGNAVSVLSGATGAVIRRLKASDASSTYFGHGLLNPGDLDGDGVDDLIVIENGCYYPADMNYYAFSGSTGATIWKAQAYTYCQTSGGTFSTAWSPVVLGDINGDGFPDWADGESYFQGSINGGFVQCHSGKDGSLIRTIYNPLGPGTGGQPSSFGRTIAAAGDVNGDGVPDLAASDWSLCEDPGGDVFFYSGADGTMLFHCHGTTSATLFGTGLTGGLDPDGDSKLDMIVGDEWDSTHGSLAGAASQLRIEPITLDAFARYDPSGGTTVRVNGGIPNNPLAIFLVGVNGALTFNLVELGTFDAARHFDDFWNVPNGLTGLTVQIVAITFRANGHLVASNDETIVFP